jgi:hypothetical protein
MMGHKVPNKTKSATVAEPKLFHQLNNPDIGEIIMKERDTSLFASRALLRSSEIFIFFQKREEIFLVRPSCRSILFAIASLTVS